MGGGTPIGAGTTLYKEYTTMVGYTPDVTLSIPTEAGPLTIHLAEGGEQFPWAAHKGRVIIGPADGTVTSDGTPLDSLDWNVDGFWVIEALDAKGDAVPLDPSQYEQAVKQAKSSVSR